MALGLIAIASLTSSVFLWRAQSSELSALEFELGRTQKPPMSVPARVDVIEAAQQRWMQQELSRVWPQLFDAIESAYGDGVRITAIDANASSGQFSVKGSARRRLDAFIFAEAMKLPGLDEVMIRSHQLQTDGGTRPISFELEGRWGLTPQGGRSLAREVGK